MEYTLNDNIGTLTFDDGKANVVGHAFLDDINAGLSRAESDGAAALILRGRPGMFSGGFDLREFEKGREAGEAMVQRGFELLTRLYSFPLPLLAACTGHGVAMGAFIIMACDTRIGARGSFKLTLPETAIGMSLPPILIELTAARIAKHHLTRVALQSEVYTPDQAVVAGFLDEVVEAELLDERVMEAAKKLTALPKAQYAANKLSLRGHTLAAMKEGFAPPAG
ncbi:MAG: enoyl-CoA hydratase [Halieaceae bacterium]|jgi:enoyl-CoA hydratase